MWSRVEYYHKRCNRLKQARAKFSLLTRLIAFKRFRRLNNWVESYETLRHNYLAMALMLAKKMQTDRVIVKKGLSQ